MKGRLNLVRLLTGIALLALLLWWTDFAEILRLILSIRPAMLPACIILAFAVPAVQTVLLGIVVHPLARVPLRHLFLLTLIGRFFSSFVPTGVGGDIVKGVYLFPYFGSPSQTYGALLMHRVIGAFSTCLVALAGGAIYLPLLGYRQLSLALLFVLICGLIAAFTLSARSGYSLSTRVETSWGTGRIARIVKFSGNVVETLRSYRQHILVVLLAFVASAAATVCFAAVNMVLAAAINIPLRLDQAIIATGASLLLLLLALTPGGIGIGETGFTAGATLMGVPAEQALAIAILGRILAIVVAIAGGIAYLQLPIPRGTESPQVNQASTSTPPAITPGEKA